MASGVAKTGSRAPTGLRTRLARQAELPLALAVVGTVAMMIVPLPPFVLDLLVSANLGLAAMLLVVTLYVDDALSVGTFPTLLLLTTLFRVGIEVSATRLVLTRADAGQVILAFGRFVAGGNLVVGAVVFLVLTLVQYIVVARGAERVAEVGARFALDGLPGRQMAIDAELRAGHIDAVEARRRRSLLARESQFMGAMDGAMKFVKGDAIAGLLVVAVNIVGGLAVGVAQRGMDFASAARTYTLLTIGEGLVAQIPALVLATAAGVLVTRVSSADGPAPLGSSLAAELRKHPRALFVAAGLMLLLALAPGLPAAPFGVLAAGAAFVAWRLRDADAGTPTRAALATVRRPLDLGVGVDLSRVLGADGMERLRRQTLPAAVDETTSALGLNLPSAQLIANDTRAPAQGCVVRLRESPIGAFTLPVHAPNPEAVMGAHFKAALARHAFLLIDIDAMNALVEALAVDHPALVREVIPRPVTLALFTEVARRLVRENVSLRDLPEILAALARAATHEKDPAVITERVRAELARALDAAHANAEGVVRAYTLDPFIEDTLREALVTGAGGARLALAPELGRDFVSAVEKAIAPAADDNGGVIITTGELRRHVRALLEDARPELAVLAHHELLPTTKLDLRGRITLA